MGVDGRWGFGRQLRELVMVNVFLGGAFGDL